MIFADGRLTYIISDNHEKHDFRYSKGGDYGSVHVDSDGIWDRMKKQYDGYFQKYTIPQNKYHQNPREQIHNHLLYYNESHVFRDYPILCYE
jgi:hypothetical protein